MSSRSAASQKVFLRRPLDECRWERCSGCGYRTLPVGWQACVRPSCLTERPHPIVYAKRHIIRFERGLRVRYPKQASVKKCIADAMVYVNSVWEETTTWHHNIERGELEEFVTFWGVRQNARDLEVALALLEGAADIKLHRSARDALLNFTFDDRTNEETHARRGRLLNALNHLRPVRTFLEAWQMRHETGPRRTHGANVERCYNAIDGAIYVISNIALVDRTGCANPVVVKKIAPK